MKENRLYIEPKSLFNQYDYRWVQESPERMRMLCVYFNHFLK